MEHLSVLSHRIDTIGGYEMVMFCDDDDTYLPTRVEEFIHAFKSGKDLLSAGQTFGGVREITELIQISELPVVDNSQKSTYATASLKNNLPK